MIENVNWKAKDPVDRVSYPHRDFAQNFLEAGVFIRNVHHELLPGMSIKISDSDGIEDCLIWIILNNKNESLYYNYSYPINFHQNNSDFRKELNLAFNSTYMLAKKRGDVYPVTR